MIGARKSVFFSNFLVARNADRTRDFDFGFGFTAFESPAGGR
jgi:hypothetical protein